MGMLEFHQLMTKSDFNDSNIEDQTKLAIISITGGEPSDKHYFKRSHANVLNISFYDIDEAVEISGVKHEPITVEQARRIIDFIEVNQNKNYIIHCVAGVSRSGAVAQFITDFYGWADKSTFNYQYGKKIIPNTIVRKRLKEEWIGKHSKLDINEYQEMLKQNEVQTLEVKEKEDGENT